VHRIQAVVEQGTKQAATLNAIREDARVALEADGVYVSTHHLETIVRTTGFEAVNEARFSYFLDPALNGFVEALEYSSILDERTTSICNHLDGRIYATDAPEWASYRPPNHFNCRSLLIPITQVDEFQPTKKAPTQDPQEGFK